MSQLKNLYSPGIFHQLNRRLSVEANSPRLPVLAELRKYLLAQENASEIWSRARKTILVAGQHALKSTPDVMGFFPFKDLSMVTKPYTSNEGIVSQLRKQDVHVVTTSHHYSLGGFDTAYDRSIFIMWAAIENLLSKEEDPVDMIILDDGGRVINAMPNISSLPVRRVVAVEQTSSGNAYASMLPYPTISLSTAAVKKVESPFVAKVSVSNMLEQLQKLPESVKAIVNSVPYVGIIGLGTIGKMMLRELINSGYKNFLLYDADSAARHEAEVLIQQLRREYPEKGIALVVTQNVASLVSNADIIIGATGKDSLANELHVFDAIRTPKVLVSVSSRDIEFRSLLQHAQRTNRGNQDPEGALRTVHVRNGFGSDVYMLRGGTPITFNGSEVAVRDEYIQPVRGLLCSALWQALEMLGKMEHDSTSVPVDSYMLDPKLQQVCLKSWIRAMRRTPDDARLLKPEWLDLEGNVEKIANLSGGAPLVADIPSFNLNPVNRFGRL